MIGSIQYVPMQFFGSNCIFHVATTMILKINDHVGNEKNTLCHTRFNRGAHLEKHFDRFGWGIHISNNFSKGFQKRKIY